MDNCDSSGSDLTESDFEERRRDFRKRSVSRSDPWRENFMPPHCEGTRDDFTGGRYESEPETCTGDSASGPKMDKESVFFTCGNIDLDDNCKGL
mmetsp:Transcript_5306/g.10558  ORF Transcript_5306/g.10558 Transcript_5306/m.10558 type:complete len:94 (-) Transcript_5306:382-663(-)